MRQVTTWMACAVLLTAGSLALAGAPARSEQSAFIARTLAESGGNPVEDELHLGTFVATILIFLCLMAILGRTAWKPIMIGLQNREQAIRDSIEAAKKAKEETERTTKELERKMEEVQRQAASQLQQAKADALKIAENIRAQAEAESVAMKDRTLREIDAAKQQAVAEINTHAAELGTAIASKLLQRSVTADDQQRLVDESLAEMARKN